MEVDANWGVGGVASAVATRAARAGQAPGVYSSRPCVRQLCLMSYIRYHRGFTSRSPAIAASPMATCLPFRRQASAPAPSAGAASTPAFSPLYQQIKALILQSLQAGEWKPGRGDPERDRTGRALPGQPGHGAQGDRRTRGREPGGAPPGQGHLRRDARRGAHRSYRFLQPDARQRRRDGRAAARDPRLPARARAAPTSRARWQLRAGDAVVQVAARAVLRAACPTILEDIWLPGVLFKGLTRRAAGGLSRARRMACSKVEFGVRMVRAEEKIRAVAADARRPRLLASRRARRCCRVERRLLSPTTTCRWSCAAASTAPTPTIIATS